MENVKLAIFDLDGTIANTAPGILYCYRSTARDYGFSELTDLDIGTSLGNSLPANLKRMLHLEDCEVEEAVMTYRDHYLERGESLSVPYDGIRRVIDWIREAGIDCAVATMKVEEYALMSLCQWNLINRFRCVHGADLAGNLDKPDLIRMCLDDCGVSPDEAVMIGDSSSDLNASRECGVRFIGVVYGFGLTPIQCRIENVPYAETVGQIAQLVLQ